MHEDEKPPKNPCELLRETLTKLEHDIVSRMPARPGGTNRKAEWYLGTARCSAELGHGLRGSFCRSLTLIFEEEGNEKVFIDFGGEETSREIKTISFEGTSLLEMARNHLESFFPPEGQPINILLSSLAGETPQIAFEMPRSFFEIRKIGQRPLSAEIKNVTPLIGLIEAFSQKLFPESPGGRTLRLVP